MIDANHLKRIASTVALSQPGLATVAGPLSKRMGLGSARTRSSQERRMKRVVRVIAAGPWAGGFRQDVNIPADSAEEAADIAKSTFGHPTR